MLFCVSAHAAPMAPYVSAGTVSFSTQSPAQAGYAAVSSTGQTVTFNSVTNYIYLRNESIDYDCRVNIECRKTDNYSGTLEYYCVVLPSIGDSNATPNTVELNFATKGLSFYSPEGTGNVYFLVTSDQGDL